MMLVMRGGRVPVERTRGHDAGDAWGVSQLREQGAMMLVMRPS